MTKSEALNAQVGEVVVAVNDVVSAQSRFPSHILLDDNDARRKYLSTGVALYNAALSGDWEAADRIITEDPTILTASISVGGLSVLHLAAGTDKAFFVRQLVEYMSAEDLELRDEKGNTALCFAAATGTVSIARILLRKNPSLAAMRGGQGMTPLYMAALFGKREMAWFLYEMIGKRCDAGDQRGIFFSCIYTGIYDLAYRMVNDDKKLATARDKDNKTALHLLAESPEAFANKKSKGWSKFFESCLKYKKKRNFERNQALDLVKVLWSQVLLLGHDESMSIIRTPEMLFDATKGGNFEFISELVKSYPDLAWEHDIDNRSIMHYAVIYRQANILNIFNDIVSIKEVLATYEDAEKNNLLHLAAKLPPLDRFNSMSRPALQLQKELLWFEEVKRIVSPPYAKKENSSKVAAEQLFFIEHKSLREQGEKFMKNTASSGMIVSALITTVVFAASFTLPSDNNNDIRALSFMVFVFSDSIALIFSIVSILMFMSILTSRYTMFDFKTSLPLKLNIGLASLFFSLVAILIAFSSKVFIACSYGMSWVAFLLSMLAFVPIVVFVLKKFSFWFDTFNVT